MRRLAIGITVAAVLFTLAAAPALACGGLVGRNGAVNLLRTTTLAGYHDGFEHYITAFTFAGDGQEFGSIVPLPAIPSNVERGGDWTLQRLVRETQPQPQFAADGKQALAASAPAEEVYRTRIDALDLVVLRGGALAVGEWAKQHEFLLPPDAPEVLDFYARRSQIFLAARFNADAARQRDQRGGEGTPIHLTIPVSNPWVPLRILSLGRQPAETIRANVYLLTDRQPKLLPAPEARGLLLDRDAPASDQLLTDLRSDKGMGWVPASAWLTALRVDAPAQELKYDLAVSTNAGAPSTVAAGLRPPTTTTTRPATTTTTAAPPTTSEAPTTTAASTPPPTLALARSHGHVDRWPLVVAGLVGLALAGGLIGWRALRA